jgi:UDP-N-acetylmuramoyl-tripeptide--D-alanyl-D-alanine ligase
VFILFSFVQLSFVTYYFQVKEYRFDRFFVSLKEKGILYYLIPERFYLPKKSIRNRNILIIHTLLTAIYYFSVFYFVKSSLVQTVLILISPLFNILTAITGILYTARIVKRKRGYVIDEAKERVKKSGATFIGITGSYGKSSTKEFLFNLLNGSFKVAKTDANHNTDIGIAMSINKNLKEDTEYFVFEVGAYKIGEIQKVVDWVNPKYGILTGLGNQHLDLFGSKENLIKAKSELLMAIPEDGKAYVNSDCEDYKKAVEGLKCEVVFYSQTGEKEDIYIKDRSDPDETGAFDVVVSCGEKDISFKSKLLGVHTLLNLLPCIGLASDLGMSEDTIKRQIEKLRMPDGKLSLHEGVGEAFFLKDSYSSNLNGFLSAIDVMGKFKAHRKIIVTKGIIELGKDKTSSYKKIIDKIDKKDIEIFTTDKFLKKLSTSNKIRFFRNENKILNHLSGVIEQGDLVLVEGRFTDKFISGLDLK